MPSRKLLFHSYHFPPVGGSGAQRPLKMVKNLADLGYESVVVTRGRDERAERWAPEDATLVAEIPEGLEIHRVTSAEPPAAARWRPIAERWLRLRDRWTAWWADSSFQLGLEAGRDADLIYVWMQPYASAEPGAALSRALGRPWVADLGDPWALDEMMVYPSALHQRLELRRMRRLLSTASAIVMSTNEAVQRLLSAFPELEDRPVVAIPNGYDADDFSGGAATQRADGTFRIVHTGYLHTELGLQHRQRRRLRDLLGGTVDGLDILTRSHVLLVDAINRLLAEDPSAADVVELHLAGVLNPTDESVARRCPVATLHGYMSHADSIELMRTADLLFLPMQNLPRGVRATIVPGKTYDYLASGTPILAAVPEGDARDILAEAGNAALVRPDDVDGMVRAIREAMAASSRGEARRRPDPDVVARFEYRRLAAQLASVFDRVLGRLEPAEARV